MSLKKQFLKSKDVCKVTFRIGSEEANGQTTAYLLGTFNQWKPEAMQRLKDGSFKMIKDLDTQQTYQFRYRLGEDTWINDHEADGLTQSEFMDSKNSLVKV